MQSPHYTLPARVFLSTPSGWRATWALDNAPSGSLISIHALRVEGDSPMSNTAPRRCWISIHALRVEGDAVTYTAQTFVDALFLSTPSGWRATLTGGRPPDRPEFLSTPSGWRATIQKIHLLYSAGTFLSTPSGWRATSMHWATATLPAFLSTPSGWRATPCCRVNLFRFRFLSTPSGWRATHQSLTGA